MVREVDHRDPHRTVAAWLTGATGRFTGTLTGRSPLLTSHGENDVTSVRAPTAAAPRVRSQRPDCVRRPECQR